MFNNLPLHLCDFICQPQNKLIRFDAVIAMNGKNTKPIKMSTPWGGFFHCRGQCSVATCDFRRAIPYSKAHAIKNKTLTSQLMHNPRSRCCARYVVGGFLGPPENRHTQLHFFYESPTKTQQFDADHRRAVNARRKWAARIMIS